MESRFADPVPDEEPAGEKKPCALLWDESFLWGIMARQALREAFLPFEMIRTGEVRRGELDHYRMLFVPGGWASSKLAALGEEGCRRIRRFVETGGNYFGICGGAGLATRDGLGLLPVSRRPSAERVASFNGGIRVSPAAHPIWQGLEAPVFKAWWPSQLAPGESVRILATYEEAQPDALSSDVPVQSGKSQGWAALEERYGLLLDPARLRGEPAVLEGRCGCGKVVLSMLHFDTPGDPNGRSVLRNLWRELALVSPAALGAGIDGPGKDRPVEVPPDVMTMLAQIGAGVDDLIACGESLALWHWRNPFLLQWRRGVRGLEYSTLAVTIRAIRDHLVYGLPTVRGTAPPAFPDADELRRRVQDIRRLLGPFMTMARELLERERSCLRQGRLSPLVCDDAEIQALRAELFGKAMSHGGRFRALIEKADGLLYDFMQGR